MFFRGFRGGGTVKDRQVRLRRHSALLAVVAVGMFGFAFALVPLYNIFCEITGLNGKTSGQVADVPVAAAVAETAPQFIEREVSVQFLAHVGRGMPWEFRPTESRLRVRLGEVNETTFYARNFADRKVTGQAVPSVTPGFAARYLHKVECFCFTQQHLEAGEDMEMPVLFYVGDDLPADIGTLSLSYTLYPVPGSQKQSSGGNGNISSGTASMDHSKHSIQ